MKFPFELSIARKYLIPKRKQLSVSLIAILSVGVISLVVCLVAVFLSVTEGIENTWLKKLTSIHAPVRITPTNHYYSSYYYQVDSLSAASDYQNKSIREKLLCSYSDPYSAETDMEIPSSFPKPDKTINGIVKDPVKLAFSTLASLQKTYPDLVVEDYEVSGAMLRLQTKRQGSNSRATSQNVLAHASYVCSFPEKSPTTSNLFLSPSAKDCLHILQKGEYDSLSASLEKRDGNLYTNPVKNVLENMTIEEVTSSSMWQIPLHLLPKNAKVPAKAYIHNDKVAHLILTKEQTASIGNDIVHGVFHKEKELLFFASGQKKYTVDSSTPLYIDHSIVFAAKIDPSSLETAKDLSDLLFSVTGKLGSIPLQGRIPLFGLAVTKCTYKTDFTEKPTHVPQWPYKVAGAYHLPKDTVGSQGIVVPKNYQENGVRIGDKGTFSYLAPTSSSMQEQQIPIFVAGFYDPGIMSIGHRFIFADANVVHSLNSATHLSTLDKQMANGIHVWHKDLSKAIEIKEAIQKAFAAHGIENYWNISSFQEYDFAKDLLQQFQSDKYLFSLVGIIILLVACCNIISLLALLVNDKKKEIGILRAMGTSSWSIALIFGFCGIFLGILSSAIGIFAAFLLLQNIDSVVQLLSSFQGHDAFNPLFYGNSLPKEISASALTFILYTTPILSFCAGLVPAIKACLLQPTQTLRNE